MSSHDQVEDAVDEGGAVDGAECHPNLDEFFELFERALTKREIEFGAKNRLPRGRPGRVEFNFLAPRKKEK